MAVNHPLVDLAADASPRARAALVSATADKFLDTADVASLMERTLFAEILVRLYVFARQDVRQKLAAALAMSEWAPVDLARELAMDTIEVAQPVISFCPALNDDVLVAVVRNCGREHRICVAERPNIGEAVSGALIASDDDKVLLALAGNITARIAPEDFQLAMDMLRGEPRGFDALVSRQDLPPSLVASAYALAGSEARAQIGQRMPPRLETRLNRLAEYVLADAADMRASASLDAEAEESLRRAARGVSGATTIKPTAGSLLAALMRGDRRIFYRGLASLLDLPFATVSTKLASPTPEAVTLVARAAHFDLGIVRTLYEQLNDPGAPWTPDSERAANLTWMSCSASSARELFAGSVRSAA